MNKHRAMKNGEAQAEEKVLNENRTRGLPWRACCGRQGTMYVGGMTAGPAPRIPLGNRGQEKKVVGNQMIEICQNLYLLCSQLNCGDWANAFRCFCTAC